MPLVFHPLLVHFPPVLWLIALGGWLLRERLHLAPAVLKMIVLMATLSTLAAFASGLWDESQAMQALKEGWRINDHRFAGIVATVLSLLAAGTVLKPPTAIQQRSLTTAALAAATVACWGAVWLGHQTIFSGIWSW